MQHSKLWERTLKNKGDSFDKKRSILSAVLDKFRDRSSKLAESIAKDNPSLTVHDITHADSLWEYAGKIWGCPTDR